MPSGGSTPREDPPTPRRLPHGPHSLSREQVTTDQRLRLVAAMIGAVGEKGYAATTVSDVIARAGVSRKTFYEHYADTQECFLATYDAIAREGVRRVSHAYQAAEGWPDRVAAAIRVLFESAIENPDALRLVMVEIAAVGPAGIERRERMMAQYTQFMREGLELAPGAGKASDQTLRAVSGGVNRVLYARLYDHRRHAKLVALVTDLVKRATSYYPPPPPIASGLPAHPPSSLRTRTGLVGGRAPGTLSLGAQAGSRRRLVGEHNVSPSFVVHNQRERILDAVANVTAAKGYRALTVKDIADEAAVSLQTFYEQFTDKEDAFLVAYEVGYTKALATFERAYAEEPDWPGAMRAALASLLSFLASEPAFAQMALVDSLIATPRTAASSNRSVAAFGKLLEPGFDAVPKSSRPPAIAVEAITGGLFEVIFDYVVHGRARELPKLASQTTYIALAPFLGAREAGRVAAAAE
jgi:AcrR family transcriptional regulator